MRKSGKGAARGSIAAAIQAIEAALLALVQTVK